MEPPTEPPGQASCARNGDSSRASFVVAFGPEGTRISRMPPTAGLGQAKTAALPPAAFLNTSHRAARCAFPSVVPLLTPWRRRSRPGLMDFGGHYGAPPTGRRQLEDERARG